MEIRFLGHSAFELTHDGVTVLIDPFLTGNPKAAASADQVAADAILVTHGHGDHLGDTVAIAKRTGASVVAIVELAQELAGDGVEDVRDPNLGGTVTFEISVPGGGTFVVPGKESGLIVCPNGQPYGGCAGFTKPLKCGDGGDESYPIIWGNVPL